MRGNPKFKYKDKVSFKIGDETKEGTIYIIDRYGTFEDPSDVSYDIMVENDKHESMAFNSETGEKFIQTTIGPCLYKHISEKYVTGTSD